MNAAEFLSTDTVWVCRQSRERVRVLGFARHDRTHQHLVIYSPEEGRLSVTTPLDFATRFQSEDADDMTFQRHS